MRATAKPGSRLTTRLRVKVVPKASGDQVAGVLGSTVKVRVTAPPERGSANAAVTTLLADALRVSRDAVRLVSGHASARKIVEIEGLDETETWRRLGLTENRSGDAKRGRR